MARNTRSKAAPKPKAKAAPKPKAEPQETAETAETATAEVAIPPAAETETATAEGEAETGDGEAAENPPAETAEEKAEREAAEFEEAVAKATEDPFRAMEQTKALHAQAVRAEEKLNAATDAHRKKNADAISSLAKVKNRLAAARTKLLAEYKAEVDANQSTTTVAVEDANKPDVVFFDALKFDFVDDNDGAEKDFWLAAQRYMTVSGKIGAEPAEVAELRKAAESTALTYNLAEAAYKEAVKRAFGK